MRRIVPATGTLATLALATAISAAPALALTITSKDGKEQTIGLDMGDKETVHTIPAGGNVTFKSECNDGCGVTGPWGYSWMAKTGEDFSFKGKELIPGRSS